MKILHVLNGDSILPIFHTAFGKEEKTLIWREILCEGPCVAQVNSENFWKVRSDFLTKEMGIKPKEYLDKTKGELKKFHDQKIEEIVLWFEYDLFCHINLIAAISYFFSTHPKTKLSLVCVGREKKALELTGLGELSPHRYPQLLKNKSILSKSDVAFAIDLWELYCSPNHEAFAEMGQRAPQVFEYMAEASAIHRKRFPSLKNQLTFIEERLLTIISQGKQTKQEVVGTILRDNNFFGFGDSQYFNSLSSLTDFYQELENGDLELNEKGQSLLIGEDSNHGMQKSYVYGGCNSHSFSYDSVNDKLIKNDRNSS